MLWKTCYGLLAILPLLTGCAWRTNHADHVFGPSLFRHSGPANANVVQTFHLPFLFEGGRQWGLSLGGIRREAVVPRRLSRPDVPGTENRSDGFLDRWEADQWHVSWIYFRAPLKETPLLIRRSIVGLHAGSGMEERAFSVGYSSTTLTTATEDALYELDFHSRQPLKATASLTPASALEAREQDHNPSPHKDPP
jgi:hypothetical protein